MARVLALSSHVAFGSVGLAAITPALQLMGHEVLAVPTIVLSNHPGYQSYSGEQIAPIIIDQMIGALEANGWLADVDAVLSGYLPTVAHIDSTKSAVERVRKSNESALFVCDPVLGDDPKGLYISGDAAAALREELLPLADLAIPNRFELSWLSGHTVNTIENAVDAGRQLPVPQTLATSIPGVGDVLASLLIDAERAFACVVERRERVPHGTGDLLSALFLGHKLAGKRGSEALALTVAQVETAIAESTCQSELSLAAAISKWGNTKPKPTRPV